MAKTAAAGENLPAVNEPKSTALSSEFADAFGGGSGFENVSAADILIPRIGIIQGLSPQIIKSKPEYIEGAKVGDICDLGLGEILGEVIHVLPIHYSKQYLEWFPRNTGKGLAAIHSDRAILDKTKPNSKNKPTLDNGNLIVETAQFYCLLLDHDQRKVFLPMASTQLKNSKRWLTLATSEKLNRADGSQFTPDLWYRTYKLSTVAETNAEGDWVGWKVERDVSLPELPNWQSIFEEVKSFRDAIAKGAVRGDTEGMEGAVGAPPSNDGDM